MSYEFYYGEDQDDPRHLRHGLTGCTGYVGMETQPSSRATSTSVEPYDDRHYQHQQGRGRSRSMSESSHEAGGAGGGGPRRSGGGHHHRQNRRGSSLSQGGRQRRPSLADSVYSEAARSQSSRNFDATKQLALAGVRPSKRSSLTRQNSDRSISSMSARGGRGGTKRNGGDRRGSGGRGGDRRGSGAMRRVGSLSSPNGGGGGGRPTGGGGGDDGDEYDEANYDRIIRAAARMSLGQGSAASSVLDARAQMRRNNSFSTGGNSSRRGSDWNLPRLSSDRMSQHDHSSDSEDSDDESEEIEIDLDMNGGHDRDHDDHSGSDEEESDDSSHTEEPKELVVVRRMSEDGDVVSDTSSLSEELHDEDAAFGEGGAIRLDDDSSHRAASSKDSLDEHEDEQDAGAATSSPHSQRSAGGGAEDPVKSSPAAAAPDPFDVMLMSSSDEEDSRGERGSNYAESMLSSRVGGGGAQGSDDLFYEGFVDRTERRREQNVRESVLARRKAREEELESSGEDALRPWRRKTTPAPAAVPETVDEEDAAGTPPAASAAEPTPPETHARAKSTSVVDDRHHADHQQSGMEEEALRGGGNDHLHHHQGMDLRRGSGMRYHDNVSLPSHSDIFSLGDAASLGGDGGYNSVTWTPRGEVGGGGIGAGAVGMGVDGGVDGGGAAGDDLPEEAQQALEALQVQREYENLFENPPPAGAAVAAGMRDRDDDEYSDDGGEGQYADEPPVPGKRRSQEVPKEGRKASYSSSLASADALRAATEFAVLSGAIQAPEQDEGHVEDEDDWRDEKYGDKEGHGPQDAPVPRSHYQNDWSGSGSRSASASASASMSVSESESARSGGQEQWRRPPPEPEDFGRPKSTSPVDPRYSEATPIIQNRKMGQHHHHHPGENASSGGSRRSRSSMSESSSIQDVDVETRGRRDRRERNREMAAAAAVGGGAAAVGVASAANSADAPPPVPPTSSVSRSMGDVESQAYSMGEFDDDTTRGDDLSILADAEDMMLRTQKVQQEGGSANGFAGGLGSLHENEEGIGNDPESSLMSSRQEEKGGGGLNRRSALKEQKQLSKGNVSVGDETWFGAIQNIPRQIGDGEGNQKRYLWYLGGFLLFALSLIAGLGVGVAVLKQDDPSQETKEAQPTPGTSPSPGGSSSLVAPQVGQSINGLADGDTLGSSVSLSSSGAFLAAGASRSNDGGVDSGHVRVFRFDSGGNVWNQLGRPIPGTQRRDFSGYSVSLSGDGMRVAIGSRFHDGPAGAHSGQARVFEYRSGSWVQLGDSMDGEAAGDEAGFCVSLSEDGRRVAVGAWKSDGFNGIDSGSVTVYEYNERGNFGAWNRLGPTIVGKAAGDTFGMSVSLSAYGNLVAIGAPKNDDAGVDSGQAQVFEYRTGFWQRMGNNIDGEDAGEWAGRAVSLSLNGRRLAVGSFGNDRGGTDSGLARVFEYDSGGDVWTQIGSSIRGAPQSQLGGSISLSRNGGRLVVGADRYGSGDVQEVGEVRTYAYSENEWVQLGQAIVGSNYQDRAGNAVSMSADGKFMAMGIYGSDEGGTNAGQARVYSY